MYINDNERLEALAEKAEQKGLMEDDHCTISIAESIAYKLIKSTLPDIPNGTKVKLTFGSVTHIPVDIQALVVIDNGVVWYENVISALFVESNTIPPSGVVVRVYDERVITTKFVPAEGEMEVFRQVIGMFAKNGTYYQGQSAEIAGEAASTNSETGELLPPEEGVTYVTTPDIRTSARRDMDTLEVSYEDWWGDFCLGGHYHDHDDEDD